MTVLRRDRVKFTCFYMEIMLESTTVIYYFLAPFIEKGPETIRRCEKHEQV